MRTSRCSPRACAPSTWSPSRRAYARGLPQLFSLECWGGATFDVAMRFLQEDPWERLAQLRERVPNLLLQMLLRGANAVGYTNYPDNVVRYFVQQAAGAGIDVFRIFDSLNWVENMRVAIDAVLETGKLCEAAICYTGDILDPRPRQVLRSNYYVGLAQGAGGAPAATSSASRTWRACCKPSAARRAGQGAEGRGRPADPLPHPRHQRHRRRERARGGRAGVDAVDAAMDAMSGLTSQPNLGSIVEALRHSQRDTGLDPEAIRAAQLLLGAGARAVRRLRERHARRARRRSTCTRCRAGSTPTCKEQARSLGLETRWPEVARAYARSTSCSATSSR